MIKIAVVFAGRPYTSDMIECFQEHNRANPSDEEEYQLEVINCSREDLKNFKTDADVVMARGIFGVILERYIHDRPLVEIPFLVSDLTKLVKKCQETFGQMKIGVIAAGNMVEDTVYMGKMGSGKSGSIGELEVQTYLLEDSLNVEKTVEQAVADGCKVIVGGVGANNYAEMLGVNHIYMETSRECFWRALTTAKRMGLLTKMQRERSEKLKRILDASQNGILALDSHRMVDTVNRSACKILGLQEEQLSGLKVQDTPLPMAVKKLLLDHQEYEDEILSFHNSTLAFRKYFIQQGSVNKGCVATFWQVSDITDFEKNIRQKVYSKGHVAKATFEEIVGHSPAILKAIETARLYSPSTSNVLLLGQSGVGKELFAQSIHNASSRRDRPFLAVNCAAIPENLLESEFFGYAAGAFTGAQKGGKAGYFELAHGGSIFLDEIGEMPFSLQAKLLRVLQEREIIRLGDGSVIPIDVRVIAATNRSLEELVSQGRFREDLFFRLDVLRINIPPLGERKEDIPDLVRAYFKSHLLEGGISQEACQALMEYEWNGNVRQLYNICERLSVVCAGREVLEKDVRWVMEDLPTEAPVPHPVSPEGELDERQRIQQALSQCRYNRTQAAAALGMDRSTLWRKMKNYGL